MYHFKLTIDRSLTEEIKNGILRMDKIELLCCQIYIRTCDRYALKNNLYCTFTTDLMWCHAIRIVFLLNISFLNADIIYFYWNLYWYHWHADDFLPCIKWSDPAIIIIFSWIHFRPSRNYQIIHFQLRYYMSPTFKTSVIWGLDYVHHRKRMFHIVTNLDENLKYYHTASPMLMLDSLSAWCS